MSAIQNIHHILDLQKMSCEELMQLEDVGVKVAASIHEFFQNHDAERENICPQHE